MPSSDRIVSRLVYTGRLIEWNSDLGYGWLQHGDKRLFLHRRDYKGRALSVGDEITFYLGEDLKGRVCAVNAQATISTVSPSRRGSLMGGVVSLFVLLLLLVLPLIAIQRYAAFQSANIVGYFILISLITYFAYASDKRRAERSDWRISEAKLHLLEMMGGWPGAWLAQRYLRHKCSKRSYQITFLIIIFAYQYAAFDSLCSWRCSEFMLQKAFELQDRGLPTLDEFKTSLSATWDELQSGR